MKYICLSFDDSRKDTYTQALPIMEKYGLKGTVNVISQFVLKTEHQKNLEKLEFKSFDLAMSIKDLLDWERKGNEIACHGSTHCNSVKDILQNIEELKEMNISVQNIGFASPNSELTTKLLYETGIIELYKNRTLLYLRSGIQVCREGIIYSILSVLEKITHSKFLFWLLQKRNIMKYRKLPLLLKSVAVKNYTRIEQIKYVIEKMDKEDCLILMFHSILNKKDTDYEKDSWYWEDKYFEELCEYLVRSENILVLTTKELVLK